MSSLPISSKGFLQPRELQEHCPPPHPTLLAAQSPLRAPCGSRLLPSTQHAHPGPEPLPTQRPLSAWNDALSQPVSGRSHSQGQLPCLEPPQAASTLFVQSSTHPPTIHPSSVPPPTLKGAPSCAPGDWSLCPCGWVSQRGSRGRERRYRSNRGSGQALGRVLLRLRLHRARQDTSQAEGPAAGPQGWKSRAVGTEDSGSDVWGRQTLAHSGAEQSGQPLAESK